MTEPIAPPSPASPTPIDPPAPTPSLISDPTKTQPTDPKLGDPPASEPVKPLTVADIKLPDGVTLDEGLSGKLFGVLNDTKLSPAARAQGLIDLHLEAMKAAGTAATTAQETAWAETQDKWLAAIKADPEIGGTKFTETTSAVGRIMARYGNDELKQALDITGFGNNPAAVKFFVALAKDFGEGLPLPGTPPTPEATAAQILYPNQGKT